jgi:predicted metal-dependent HD superfamily phosphohydrolase
MAPAHDSIPLERMLFRGDLVRADTASDRHDHDLSHIDALLARQHAGLLADREAVDAAIWFPDAIYDTRRNDSEAKSADLAVEKLSGSVANDRLGHIAAMIRATAGHTLPNLPDADALRDCAQFLAMDLAVLASPPDQFAAYERAVRREYAWVAEPLWIGGRRKVLARFLDRAHIYASPEFRASHEAAARENLHRALAALTSPADLDRHLR